MAKGILASGSLDSRRAVHTDLANTDLSRLVKITSRLSALNSGNHLRFQAALP